MRISFDLPAVLHEGQRESATGVFARYLETEQFPQAGQYILSSAHSSVRTLNFCDLLVYIASGLLLRVTGGSHQGCKMEIMLAGQLHQRFTSSFQQLLF